MEIKDEEISALAFNRELKQHMQDLQLDEVMLPVT